MNPFSLFFPSFFLLLLFSPPSTAQGSPLVGVRELSPSRFYFPRLFLNQITRVRSWWGWSTFSHPHNDNSSVPFFGPFFSWGWVSGERFLGGEGFPTVASRGCVWFPHTITGELRKIKTFPSLFSLLFSLLPHGGLVLFWVRGRWSCVVGLGFPLPKIPFVFFYFLRTDSSRCFFFGEMTLTKKASVCSERSVFH